MKQYEELLAHLNSLKKFCYVPYSKFKVVCSIYLKNGKIINGVNIENAAYNPTICAERAAISQLITNGFKDEEIKYIALFSESNIPIYPCGTCRQTLSEFIDFNTNFLIFNSNGFIEKRVFAEFLPYSFNKTYIK
ncbi:cytidine deaminase [Spiroplasma turonicum]|uniref:Cytidine deaminase n=1 Tax=Spiroplasma turonicum TaxID=216946 RepID=A0A0K1P5G2_9MOLU|nr:cytidine deaminase [Spiroplasma turonicum]AKU79518.1 cytidine deaminase [Spiroplasma turonicum]ALX70541.1 cytidine deaminase [Spiroplasma turonicum]